MSKKYSAEDISSLTGMEHVRARVAMYLGSSGSIGLFQCVKEIVSNSVDEALNDYADRVIVELLEPNKISISDNGRGIPVGVNSKTGKTALDMCIGDTNSGGKLTKDNYKTSAGTFGVGSSAVNAVSSKFEAIVQQEGKIHQVEYRKGVKVSPKDLSKTNIIGTCDKKDTGTTIIFTPDPTIMEVVNFDVEEIMVYLQQLSFLNSGIRFIFTDSRDIKKGPETTEYYTENGLVDYVKELMKEKKPLTKTIIHKNNIVLSNGDTCDFAFQYAQEHKLSSYLFVNKNSIPNGGTAVVGFKMGFTKALNDISRLLGYMRPKEKPLRSSDVEEGLVLVISMNIANPELEGQTKNKLNNSNIQGFMQSTINEIMKLVFEETPKLTSAIAEKSLLGRRAREASLKARNLIMNKIGASTQSPVKLKGCKSNKAEECEVMFVEGDSASSGIAYGRDANTQAYFPLRGKVKNVEKLKSLVEVLEYDVYKDINNILGCGFGDSFDINKLKYHKIIILTDADVDGLHITSLLLTYLYRCYKPLLENGYVYVCIPPLYCIKWGKDHSEYLTNEASLEVWKKNNPRIKEYSLKRFKGLGEMTAPDLASTCIHKDTRQLVRISIDDLTMTENAVTKLMGKDVSSRKVFFQTHGEKL